MLQSRVSLTGGQTRNCNTDSLYDPLRQTLLLDTTAKKQMLDQASLISNVSHVSRTHTRAQNNLLVNAG
jgi:hypothetical protein